MVRDLLQSMQQIDPQLQHWYRKGRSRSGSNTPIDLEDIASELKQNLRDDNRQPIIELGYSFSAWNGESVADEVSISAKSGNTSGIGRNNVIMTFGRRWAVRPHMLEIALRGAVRCLNLEHGILMLDDAALTPGVPPWEQAADIVYTKVQGFAVCWKT
jgi:hypothetical protein